MARKTKEQVIELLQAKGITFEETTSYKDLCALLKDAEASENKEPLPSLPPEQEAQCKVIHKERGWPQDMIRLGFKVGFIEEQIRSFADVDALHAAIGRIKPALLAGAGKPPGPPPPPPPVEMEEKTATLDLSLSPMRAKTPLRAEDEQRDIDAFLNRKGIRRAVTKLEITRHYTPGKDNKFLTEVTIYYEGAK